MPEVLKVLMLDQDSCQDFSFVLSCSEYRLTIHRSWNKTMLESIHCAAVFQNLHLVVQKISDSTFFKGSLTTFAYHIRQMR